MLHKKFSIWESERNNLYNIKNHGLGLFSKNTKSEKVSDFALMHINPIVLCFNNF